MRAAVLAAPQRVEVWTLPRPAPGPGEVRIRLEGCGVCGSNLPVWEGRPWFAYPRPPGSPGHEGWGRVEAVGPEVDGLAVGQRVAFLDERAFATHAVVPAARCVPLPPELDAAPVPGEALACAVNVLRRAAVRPGERVAVVGVGFLGALLVQLLVAEGAEVVALSRRPEAVALARRLGAVAAWSLEDPRAEAAAWAASGQQGYSCVIEATGLPGPLDLAGRLTAVRGRLVIAGYHQDGPRTVDLQLWNWRGLDVLNAHERDEAVVLDGLRAAVQRLAAGWDPTPLYTHQLPLAELGQAFALLRDRPPGFLKALVRA